MNDELIPTTVRTKSHMLLVILAAGIIAIGVIFIAISYTNNQKSQAVHAYQQSQYKASLAACKRGNIVREHINITTGIQREFMKAASAARRAQAKAATTEKDRNLNNDAADRYSTLAAKSTSLPLIDCNTAFTRP